MDSETVYDDFTKEELTEFINNLNLNSFNKILEFYLSTPKLKKDVSFDCEKCGTHNSLVLEGLQNFFG